MTAILAGHFQLQDEIDAARQALRAAGFADERISSFFVNPPGQHATFGPGGDRALSPGAKETPAGLAKGAATGGVIGAAVGAVTAPVTGPLGPVVGGLLGAHVGSLYSFSEMKEAGAPEAGGENRAPPRQPGMMIAVAVTPQNEAVALALLRRLGAHHLERAEGTIEAGDWRDFDPLSAPRLVAGSGT
ncbi:hypothetical protein MJ904_15815 [Massilia sp. MB5]|uniref:hypothetical protein n=1 Tax=Massilia sp. MB5 TaxID=2919578 RepID=UPI001F0E8729|nr:hypothetical protein [Massilia sp. MB5]UMR28607.1 hypothetical protein MJ904_15815 [Massilia sp. MB5]